MSAVSTFPAGDDVLDAGEPVYSLPEVAAMPRNVQIEKRTQMRERGPESAGIEIGEEEIL